MESEKITKFFPFERRTISIASRMAYNSALKMLAVSGNRTHLLLSMDHSSSNSVTFFRAIGKYAIVILELMTEFIKRYLNILGGVLLLSEQCRVKLTAGRGVVGIEDVITSLFSKPTACRSPETRIARGGN